MTNKKQKYNIDVSVKTEYLADNSDVDNDQYAFAYMVTIHNVGMVGGQIVSRHWLITDSNDNLHEIRGDGVVGEQPFLKPGETYKYTSNALLETPVGTMSGAYTVLAEDGTQFDAPIKQFTLSIPRMLH